MVPPGAAIGDVRELHAEARLIGERVAHFDAGSELEGAAEVLAAALV